MYHLPGLNNRTAAFVVELAEQEFADWHRPVGRPKKLSLLDALRLTLRRLRRNATYNDLHEDFGVAISTAWEYHQPMVTFLADLLGCTDDLPALVEGKICLIDGSLIPTFNWRHRKDLLNGKHRRHGVNIQLFVDVHGRLIGVSRAFPGSWHDVHCCREAGWVELTAHCGGMIGNLGYQGEPDVATPIKKKQEIKLTDSERRFNTRFAQIRVAVEWGMTHLEELADHDHPLSQQPQPHRH